MEFKNLVLGEVLSESQYYKTAKIAGDKVQLTNDKGENIVVNKDYVENCLSSGTQYKKEEKVTQTRLAEILLSNARVAMTVMYNKKLDPKNVKASVADVFDKISFGMTKTQFQKEVNSIINLKGDERTMTGRHYGDVEPTTGRLKFVDMNVTSGIPVRQVDPRTINYIIVNNVKYILK